MNAKPHTKRKVADIPIFLDRDLFKQLENLVNAEGYNYKKNMDRFRLRDKALQCLLILTGLRISEALQLKKKQFKHYEDHILLANVETLKNGLMRSHIILPLKGNLSSFTQVLGEWLNHIPEPDDYVFPSAKGFGSFNFKNKLSRYRAHRILKLANNLFPHWYRAVCETIYGRMVFHNDAWKLKQFMGLKRLDSTTPYVKGTWEEDEDKIFQI